MRKYFPLISVFIFCCYAFYPDPETLFSIPDNFPKPVYNFKNNPLTKEKIFLGRTLFYDPILSKDNTISCASCHLQYSGFTHTDHATSHGIDGKIGNRNSPTLINLAWSKSFMWDGSVHQLDSQAIAPIENPSEMGEKLSAVVQKLNSSKFYKKLFYQTYGDSTATGEKTLKCISQFLVTLVSSNAKYDKVMRKENGITFSKEENNGYKIFQQNRASCHKEPLFTNGDFENNGLKPDNDYKDGGRIKITKKIADSLKFKVPTLRNIELSYPYMHDGRYRNLQMVLFHYTNNLYPSDNLSKKLKKKIQLNESQKNDLIAFLKTLTDEDFIKDQKFSYPK